MHDHKLAVLIMAAGKGTRMKSDLPKVLHKLSGRPLIQYVIDIARKINASLIVPIIGHKKDLVIEALSHEKVTFAVQEPQLGTGHAIMCALPEIDEFDGSVLILSGDVPLIKAETLGNLLKHHISTNAAATVLTAITETPQGYGRIVRNNVGHLEAIVEERDAADEIRKIQEINSGIYVFNAADLRRVLPLISDHNDQKEYYLTDAVRLLTNEGKLVGAVVGAMTEAMGINTVNELKAAEKTINAGT
ncbi:NTP transferase domain-containing protein [bacterium]|nr:NTP transferase domain-containing protein [bacterium]